MEGLLEKLKQVYYNLEEKWYALIEKINTKIPIVKFIDAVDKVAPSFLVFLSIILLFFIVIGLFLFFGLSHEYTFRVLNEQSSPLEGVKVSLSAGDSIFEFTTDSLGEFKATLSKDNVLASVSHEGFEDFSQEIALQKDVVNEIVLTLKPPELERKFIVVANQDGKPVQNPVLVSYACQTGAFGPGASTVRLENGSEFWVDYVKTCGELSGTFSSQGFKDTTKALLGTRNEVRLEPLEISLAAGSITVKVVDKVSKAPLPNISVKLVGTFPVQRELNEGRSSAIGGYSFEAKPGKYLVVAADVEKGRYKPMQSLEFELSEGESKSVSIELEKNVGERNRLFLQLVDSGTSNGILGVVASLFDANLPLGKKDSDQNGFVQFDGLDEDKNYFMSVVHPDYIAKVFSGLKPIDRFSDAKILLLEKATQLNSGTVKVKLSSAEGSPVGSQKVFLKNLEYPFYISQMVSDQNGVAVFKSMPAGKYKAFSDTLGFSASSTEGTLAAGATLELSLELVLKTGFLKVKVFDRNSVVVPSAQVTVFDAITGSALAGQATTAAGETGKIALPWNKIIYFSVNVQGFLPFYSSRFSLSPDSTKNVNVFLYREQEAVSFDFVFERALDEKTKNPLPVISPNTVALLEFTLLSPQGSLTKVEAVVEAGLKAQLSSKDTNIVILGVERPQGGFSAVFSECATQNEFEACSPTNDPAKKVNISAQALEAGAYQFLVKVQVKPSAKTGDLMEVHFGAQTNQGGVQVRKPSSGLYVKQFVLGQPVLCEGAFPRCPQFAFRFFISNPSGLHFNDKKELTGQAFELVEGTDYILEYTVHNLARPKKSFSNSSIEFSDALSTGAIEISPTSVSVSTLEPDTSFSGPPVSINAIAAAKRVELQSRLLVDHPGAQSTLIFSVLARKKMNVSVSPQKIFSGVFNYLSITANEEGTNAPIANIIAKISSTQDFAEPILVSSLSANDGRFVFEVPPFPNAGKIYLKVESFGYQDTGLFELEVSDVFAPQETFAGLGCIVVDDKSPGPGLEIRLVKGQSFTFELRSNNCPEKAQVYLSQRAAGEPLTLVLAGDNSALNDSVNPSFELEPNARKELRITADKLLGEYALFVQAKFSSEEALRDHSRVSVFVQPSSFDCFALSKTSFNIQPRDSAILTNNCAVFSRDPFNNRVTLATEKATLDSDSLKLFAEQEFSLTQAMSGLMYAKGQDFRTVRFSVKTADAPQINEAGIAQSGLEQYLPLLTFLGKGPPILMPIIIGFVFLDVASQLGPAEHLTCNDCQYRAQLVGDEGKLLAGNHIENAMMTFIEFNDGGYLKVNTEFIGIPESGPNPNLSSSEKKVFASANGSLQGISFTGTGLQGLPSGGFGGGGGIADTLMQGLNFFTNIFKPPEPQDSCDSHYVESSNCSGVSDANITSGEVSLEVSQFICKNISGIPRDVTTSFRSGYNNIDLFACNKVNDGGASVEFRIKDSVDLSVQKDYSFIPAPVATEVGVLDQKLVSYFDDAPFDSQLKFSLSSGAPFVDAYYNGKKIMANTVLQNVSSKETPFEVINSGLEGEQFAVMSFESLSGGSVRPKLEVVLLVDTSKSFENEVEFVCAKKSRLLEELSARNIDATIKVYSIGTQNSLSCLDGVATWGDEAAPSPESFANEAWGPAIQELLNGTSLSNDARKLFLVFTDTLAEGKGNENSPTQNSSLEESGENDEPTVGAPTGTVLSRTIAASTAKNAVLAFAFGVPLENESALPELELAAKDTNGFVKAFQPEGDEALLADLILASAFPKLSQSFHVRLVGSTAQLCAGPNGTKGQTGQSALPKVLFSWDWQEIQENSCDQSLGQNFAYCDAVQFSKSLAKKLFRIKNNADKAEFGELNSLTVFNSYLIKDSYSDAFFRDFDSFVKTKEFLPPTEYTQSWTKYFSDSTRLKFVVDGQSGSTLPESGLYSVNLKFSFAPQKQWIFFDAAGNPIATIEVRLKLLQKLESKNPLYYLPLDGLVGLKGTNSIERNGYGTIFSGQEPLGLLPQTASSVGFTTYTGIGQGIASMEVTKITSFEYVNSQNRGVLLKIRKNNEGYSFDYSPHFATPVMLEVSSENGQAHAYVELRKNSEPLFPQSYLGLWSGTASTIPTCKDFEGNNLLSDKADNPAGATACQFRDGISPQNSRGFSFNAPFEGKVFLKTVVFAPENGYALRNACSNQNNIITPLAISVDAPVELSFGLEDNDISLTELFSLVKEEKVCVGEENDSVSFWWNNSYLFNELNKNAQIYFTQLAQTESGLSQCIAG